MRDEPALLPLHDIRLPDAGTGQTLHLGDLADVHVLTLIRHRY